MELLRDQYDPKANFPHGKECWSKFISTMSRINACTKKYRPTGGFLVLMIMGLWSANLGAVSFFVNNYDSFNKAQQRASAGDTIMWQSGTYEDVVIDIVRDGIVFISQELGRVIFTGQSSFVVFADSVLVGGFQFKNGQVSGDIMKISGSHNVIEQINFSNYRCHYYLNILPEARWITIKKCNFERKPEVPATSVVQIQVDELHPGYHVVRHCSFRDHTAPDTAGGDYGIEALRIGYSFQSTFISRTIVEYCYFTNCMGDGEIISSKAWQNVYRYNTFENNGDSHFTLRHGSENVVYGNFFINGAGIRIKEGQNHMIYNNYFQTGERFSIKLMNHHADPLEGIKIVHNTFASSGPILLGAEGNHMPQQISLVANLFLRPPQAIVMENTGSEFLQGNLMSGISSQKHPNFDNVAVATLRHDDLIYPAAESMQQLATAYDDIHLLDIPELDDDPSLQFDIMQQNRTRRSFTAGCFQPTSESIFKRYVTSSDCGPSYSY